MCAKSYTVGPQQYRPTCLPAGSSGTKSCSDRDSVLKNFKPISEPRRRVRRGRRKESEKPDGPVGLALALADRWDVKLVAAGVSPAVEGGILPPGTRPGFANTQKFQCQQAFQAFIRRAGRAGSTSGEDARRYPRSHAPSLSK